MDRERAVRAVNAMKAIGIIDEQVKPLLLNLLELFNWNWEHIEAEDYRALKDTYFDFKENQGEEDENERAMGQDRLERPSKRLHLGQQKDPVSSAMANSSKTLALKEAEMPMPASGQGSKKPSQPCLTDRRRGSSSQIPNEQVSCKRKDLTSSHLAFQERKSTHNGESQAVYIKQPLDKHGSSRRSGENSATSHCSRKLIKTKTEQPISGVAHHAEPISVVRPGSSAGSSTEKHLVKSLASQHERTINEDDASICNDSASSNNNFVIASSAMAEVKIFLNCTHAFERPNFQSPNFDAVLKYLEYKNLISENVKPQFSVKKLLEDLCETFLELGNKSTSGPVAIGSSPEAIINVEDSLSVTGLKKRAFRVCDSERDLNKKSSNRASCLNTSNLATVQQRPVTYNEKRSTCISDIAKGLEIVRIPLVAETCNEDLPKFTYIPQNVIYQNAYVHISLARISDEDCCSNCSGDCLSLSIPCACTRETGGEFAYTQQGLLKEEFLSACMSMKKGPSEEHLVYCQDCPIERSNNEYSPEKCKGHIVRKFIKECWRKCGCSMQCRNRIVQRGITCKLQVFLTHGLKGWGLRTLQDLPKGTFVCEYVGEILTNTELYERNMQSSSSERHTYPVTLDADWGSERVLRDEEALCLDATFCGNVARFINHRCFDANLIDIPVEVETPDRHYYHLAFFTTRDVSASEELTWDYGIDFNDHNHPIKAFHCCCGSEFCRDVK